MEKIRRKKRQISSLNNQRKELTRQVDEIVSQIKSYETEIDNITKIPSDYDYEEIAGIAESIRMKIESLLDRLGAIEKYSKEVTNDLSDGTDSAKIVMLKADMEMMHAEFVKLNSFYF